MLYVDKNYIYLTLKIRYKLKKFFIIIFSIVFFKCNVPGLESDIVIYENDFENDTQNINSKLYGNIISNYNYTNVIGPYNNDGFSLHINEIDESDLIFISFDLYIHGTWDGNFNGFKAIEDKPDKWILKIGNDLDLNSQTTLFQTTFSNSVCFPNYCLRQSYPNLYPFENIPKTGSIETNLPPICDGFWGGKTTLYKIEKTFRHKGNALVLRFYDELFQPNAIDDFGNNVQKCDESWSIDNLVIRSIRYK